MSVGQEIRRKREKKGWSQAKLAAAADMAVSGISQIETGVRNPSAVTLQKIADALDASVADFFPKAQVPLPLLEGEDVRRRGWESAARVRIELLEDSADLWEKQIARGQYDLETIKEMDQVAFRLGLGHILEEPEMKRWCTQEQHKRLERAEERFEEAYETIWRAFEAEFEREKTRLSREQVTYLEEYKAKRRDSLRLRGEADTG